MHVFPDLEKLERKYPKELVVIGVHSAKFTTERGQDNIRKAILRFGLTHPVVNDAEFAIWRRYGISAWPTLVLIAPDGNVVWAASGEGHFDALDARIGILARKFEKTLNREPMRWKLETEKESVLSFPGKVCATADRLFIADTDHHRILITTLDGAVQAVIGSGRPGRADGAFDKAEFNEPQGLAVSGDVLYAADMQNNLIRRVDLKARRVETIAGTGERAYLTSGGPALKTPLNSPWDVLPYGQSLFIAMAGNHSIWVLDFDRGTVKPYAGNGWERLRDGPLGQASFNQPSGLAILNGRLYVADSEASAVRELPLDGRGEVATVVGMGLFDFGDVDGVGTAVRLQHDLAVLPYEGKLLVADTYNHKIKLLDPAKGECRTFVGDGLAGFVDGKDARFNEPCGLAIAGGKLFVADQNNNAIRVVDLATREVSTLRISGLK